MTESEQRPTDHDLGCFWHGEEPIPEGAYRVCGECGHCYVTRGDLVAEDVKIRQHIGVPLADPSLEIYVCPLCTHDF